MIEFILNIPYTIIGLVIGVVSIPIKISHIYNLRYAIILNVRSLWWTFSYAKNARAATFGNVVLLGPLVEDKDLEHELVHIEQFMRMPLIFPLLYYWELFNKGYRKNKYEIEAYTKAGNVYKLSEKR